MTVLEKIKQNKLPIAIALIALIFVGGAAASTIIQAPEEITGTPLDKPTPTPTTAPTPTPTPQPALTLHLTSNNTVPFYKGDTLHITATLSAAIQNVNVTLYNNGAYLTSALTDAGGQANFDRKPQYAFNYTASAYIP